MNCFFFYLVFGYISRFVVGSYDNEGIVIFVFMFIYYLWVSVFWRFIFGKKILFNEDLFNVLLSNINDYDKKFLLFKNFINI